MFKLKKIKNPENFLKNTGDLLQQLYKNLQIIKWRPNFSCGFLLKCCCASIDNYLLQSDHLTMGVSRFLSGYLLYNARVIVQ